MTGDSYLRLISDVRWPQQSLTGSRTILCEADSLIRQTTTACWSHQFQNKPTIDSTASLGGQWQQASSRTTPLSSWQPPLLARNNLTKKKRTSFDTEIMNSEYIWEEEAYNDRDTNSSHRKLVSKSFMEVTGTELILLYTCIKSNYTVQHQCDNVRTIIIWLPTIKTDGL